MNAFFHDTPTIIIERGKQKSIMLAEAVRESMGGDILYEPDSLPAECSPVFVGLRPATAPLLHDLHRTNRSYVTIDNGYFRPYKEGGYFRVTQNGLQTSMPPEQLRLSASIRWAALNIQLQPLREPTAGHVLLVLQSEAWYQMVLGCNREDWVRLALDFLERTNPGVPIKLRDKPLKGRQGIAPLQEDLDGACAVAALSSAVLLEAAVQGLPIYALGVSAASGLHGNRGIDLRQGVFSNLADNQWTVDEIASGHCWEELAARKPPYFLDLA